MLVLINDFNTSYLPTDKLLGDVSGGRAAGLRRWSRVWARITLSGFPLASWAVSHIPLSRTAHTAFRGTSALQQDSMAHDSITISSLPR